VYRRAPIIIGVAVVAAVILGELGATSGNSHLRNLEARRGVAPVVFPAGVVPPGAKSGAVLGAISAAGVDTVEVDQVAGQMDITATSGGTIGDAGSSRTLLYWIDSSKHTLHLLCYDNGACPASDYTVTIPEHVGLTLRQTAGESTLNGISGPVDITANSADTTATGLETGDFTADIISGQLNATFDGTPNHVTLTVASAQATLHLPSAPQYAVATHTASGQINVGVSQNPNSADTVDATVTSGEIDLLDH
jgi:hypothetical protein